MRDLERSEEEERSEPAFSHFNLRAYGVLIEDGAVLLSREWLPIYPSGMTKFPGGGVELGEGVGEALVREFQEELGIQIRLGKVLHVPHKFLKSAFDQSQLVSIYFQVFRVEGEIETKRKEYLTDRGGKAAQKFLWKSREELDPERLTFPFDQELASKIKQLDEIWKSRESKS